MADETSPPYVPPEGPPQEPPSREIYGLMGEENIFRMCRDFYGLLEKSEIRPLFPADMPEASKKLAEFLVGLLGGPPLFHQRHGPPRMRARHLPFAINARARDVWFGCFEKILEDAPVTYSFPRQHVEGFRRFLSEFSRWMVNRA